MKIKRIHIFILVILGINLFSCVIVFDIIDNRLDNNSIEGNEMLEGIHINSVDFWDTTELVSTESSGNSYAPAIKVDDFGNIHILWRDPTNYNGSGGDLDIFYKMWNATSRNWAPLEVVSTESDAMSYQPEFAVDNLGNVHVTWGDVSNYNGSGSDRDIFYKRRKIDNHSWTITEIVSEGMTSDSKMPKIDVDIDGNAYIVWYDRTTYGGSGSDDDIFLRRWNASIDSWGVIELVSSGMDEGSLCPSIALDNFKNIHVSWHDFSRSTDSNIFYKRWIASSKSWETFITVSTGCPEGSWQPKIDTDDLGNVYIVWDDESAVGGAQLYSKDIFFKKRYVSSGSWSGTQVISLEKTGLGDNQDANLSVDKDGNVNVVWLYGLDIYYRRNDVSDGLWKDIYLVGTGLDPSVYAENAETVYVTWRDTTGYGGSGSDNDITYRKGIFDYKLPIINVNFPYYYALFNDTNPSFEVEVEENHLKEMWYTLDDGITNVPFNSNASIDSSIWSQQQNGSVKIEFYAEDICQNVGYSELIVFKNKIDSIIIDDNSLTHNWSNIAFNHPWVSGEGTWEAPYIIEYMNIIGSGTENCIEIRNSEVYFTIKNCSFVNTVTGNSANGIRLYYTKNGRIEGNNYNNTLNGVSLSNSDNNTIMGNEIKESINNGIYLSSSHENIIRSNCLVNNSNSGMYLSGCDNNFIQYNNASLNKVDGILIAGAEYNNITDNSFSFNSRYGFNLYRYCFYNIIKGNNITHNSNHGFFIDKEGGGYSDYNLILENNISYNKRMGIACVGRYQFRYNNISRNYILYNDGDGLYMTDDVSSNIISSNEINNNNGVGIHFDEGCSQNLIEDNIINYNLEGVRIFQGGNNNISRNDFNNNEGNGLYIYSSNGNGVINNTAKNHKIGFYIYNNYGTFISGNKFKNCGLLIRGILNMYSSTTVQNNLVNDKPLYYYINENDLKANNFSNAGQIILINCSNSNILGLNLSKTTVGVYLYESSNNTISDSIISENKLNGIWLDYSSNNIILNNNISKTEGNVQYYTTAGGLCLLHSCHNNIIFNNSFFENMNYGFYLSSGSGNTIYKNHFVDNLVESYGTGNYWDNGSIGNYWDYYEGKDVDNNGIGDSPHLIYKYGQDNYPIWWDGIQFTVIYPQENDVFGQDPPDFELSYVENFVKQTYYSLNGSDNIFFSGNNGIIDQNVWNLILNGTLMLKFTVEDLYGFKSSIEMQIRKDIILPEITIIEPFPTQIYDEISPYFQLIIIEPNLKEIWYSIDGGVQNISCGFNGNIDPGLWSNAPEGNITIEFFAIDLAGNINTASVVVEKYIDDSNSTTISGFNVLFLIIGTMVSVLIFLKKYDKK